MYVGKFCPKLFVIKSKFCQTHQIQSVHTKNFVASVRTSEKFINVKTIFKMGE